jgi:hypothetical protein
VLEIFSWFIAATHLAKCAKANAIHTLQLNLSTQVRPQVGCKSAGSNTEINHHLKECFVYTRIILSNIINKNKHIISRYICTCVIVSVWSDQCCDSAHREHNHYSEQARRLPLDQPHPDVNILALCIKWWTHKKQVTGEKIWHIPLLCIHHAPSKDFPDPLRSLESTWLNSAPFNETKFKTLGSVRLSLTSCGYEDFELWKLAFWRVAP